MKSVVWLLIAISLSVVVANSLNSPSPVLASEKSGISVFNIYYQSFNESKALSSAVRFLKNALPILTQFLRSQPLVNYLGVDRIIGLPICKVLWNSSGVYIEVREVRIESSWIPYYLYVTLNTVNSTQLNKFVSKNEILMLESLRSLYNSEANKAHKAGFNIVGFGIYFNKTPIAFLRPGPYIDAARIYWGARFEGSLFALAFLNEYPIVYHFVKSFSYKFSLTSISALNKLKPFSSRTLTVEDIQPYILIFNGSIRPAYIAYLDPYRIGIVFADTGTLIYPGNYSTFTSKSTGISSGLENFELYLTLIIIIAVTVALILVTWWVKLKRL